MSDFKERMRALSGELLSLTLTDAPARRAAVWAQITKLHAVFGQSNRIDDLVALLLLAREEFLHKPWTEKFQKALLRGVERMALETPSPELALQILQDFKAAGVNVQQR